MSFIAFKLLRFDKDISFTKEGRITFMRLDNKKKRKKEKKKDSYSMFVFSFLCPSFSPSSFSFRARLSRFFVGNACL